MSLDGVHIDLLLWLTSLSDKPTTGQRGTVRYNNNNNNNNKDNNNNSSSNNNNNNKNNDRIERRNSWFFFFTISSPRRKLSPTSTLKWPRQNYVQITCNTLDACHMQHVCLVVQRDSDSFWQSQIVFILALLYWLKQLIDEGGDETGVHRENPWWQASENAMY